MERLTWGHLSEIIIAVVPCGRLESYLRMQVVSVREGALVELGFEDSFCVCTSDAWR